jgi:hypothetical protein
VPKYNQTACEVKGKEGFFSGYSGLKHFEQLIDQQAGDLVGELLALNGQV